MATTRDQIAAAWRDEMGRPGPDQPLDALQDPQPFFFPGLTARPFWDPLPSRGSASRSQRGGRARRARLAARRGLLPDA